MSDPSDPSSPRLAGPAGADVTLCPIPRGLVAAGAARAPFRPALAVDDLSPGAMRRVTFADLDLLVAHTPAGIVVTDDRCPHMAAPLSIGTLDGCVVDCVLHRAAFDLTTGAAVTYPTTGSLDADGGYHAPWAPAGSAPKPEAQGTKAQARAMTRTRRMRFYPSRVRDGYLEIRVPGS
jgi:nitrite reductase/ring-hydroxylating ferredoxin subunit